MPSQKESRAPLNIVAIEDLAAAPCRGRTLAGLDLGDKTIGVAVSDRGLSFAHPRPVIMRKKFSARCRKRCWRCSAKEKVGAVVIGLPVNMDGSEGPRAQASRAFVRNMAQMTDLPFVFWDERLSTVAAERSADRDGHVARQARRRRSIRPPPPSSCRACWTGFTTLGEEARQPR